ncbi:MAG: hypothetical protein K0A90_01780 [Methanosarcinaceae archaeon]|nr:hypothetical protein [Methanosarcinaceae archaeon]
MIEKVLRADRACQYSGYARDRGAGSYVKVGTGGLVFWLLDVSGDSGFCGLDMLDAISMMLIAIGDNFKNINKKTGGNFISQKYPDIQRGRSI